MFKIYTILSVELENLVNKKIKYVLLLKYMLKSVIDSNNQKNSSLKNLKYIVPSNFFILYLIQKHINHKQSLFLVKKNGILIFIFVI